MAPLPNNAYKEPLIKNSITSQDIEGTSFLYQRKAYRRSYSSYMDEKTYLELITQRYNSMQL